MFLVKTKVCFLFSRKTLGFIFRDVLLKDIVEKVLWPIHQSLAIPAVDFGAARITQILNSLCLICSRNSDS